MRRGVSSNQMTMKTNMRILREQIKVNFINRGWWVLLLILLAFSCGGDNLPKGILPKDKMIPILVDQHLAENIFTQRFALGMNKDKTIEDLYLSVLKKYNVSQKVFEESVFYYSKHPDKYKSIYDEVLNRLNAMDVKVKQEDITLKR
jgi:hypothetical protein